MTAASCLAQSGFAIKAEAVCTEEGRESAHGLAPPPSPTVAGSGRSSCFFTDARLSYKLVLHMAVFPTGR